MNVSAIQKSLNELQELMEDEHINTDIKEEAKNDIVKLKNALEYYFWLDRLVDSFESHEIFNFIPKE